MNKCKGLRTGWYKQELEEQFLVDNSRIFVRNILPTTGFQGSSFFIVSCNVLHLYLKRQKGSIISKSY